MNVFHYTNKAGWNAIRSQVAWRFLTLQPPAKERPVGAYFTTIEPTPQNLRTLFKRIRVPKVKQEFVFWFAGTAGLKHLNGGRGRDRRILFSPVDYDVEKERHRRGKATETVMGEFT
ncbi:MAG: hypothetical protein HQ581_07725 [Planctomycetes bacterium]|nr:hypothetical protein [Planctomycetota bacterium]